MRPTAAARCATLPKVAGSTDLLEMQVTASKPQYAVGAKATITLRPKQQPKQTSWTLAADNADDDELLDEEDLLTEEDRQRPAVIGELYLVDCGGDCLHVASASSSMLSAQCQRGLT